MKWLDLRELSYFNMITVAEWFELMDGTWGCCKIIYNAEIGHVICLSWQTGEISLLETLTRINLLRRKKKSKTSIRIMMLRSLITPRQPKSAISTFLWSYYYDTIRIRLVGWWSCDFHWVDYFIENHTFMGPEPIVHPSPFRMIACHYNNANVFHWTHPEVHSVQLWTVLPSHSWISKENARLRESKCDL